MKREYNKHDTKYVSVYMDGYVGGYEKCDICEFESPCRLCTWVSEDDMNLIYNDDVERLLPHNKQWHVKEKRRVIRNRIKMLKGRDNKKKSRKMSINDDVMEL